MIQYYNCLYHVELNKPSDSNAAVTFPISLGLVEPEATSWDAGVHTDSKASFTETSSRTISGDVANSVHAMEAVDSMSAHVRNVWPSFEPKNNEPDGVEKEETDESISWGVIDPKRANSKTGMEESELNNSDVFEGGTAGPSRTNWTSSIATVAFVIAER